jgi:hypothetical protein
VVILAVGALDLAGSQLFAAPTHHHHMPMMMMGFQRGLQNSDVFTGSRLAHSCDE